MMLPLETFRTIIENTPLVSIDFVVYNQSGEVLLGKRKNRPAQGCWFVPGGRILKDELMSVAFKRLTKNELGTEFSISEAKFIGPFEHLYQDNISGSDFSTHYIALGYRLVVNGSSLTLPIEQHGQYIWISESELIKLPDIHRHTLWYFDLQA